MQVEKQTRKCIKIVRYDQGGEYTSRDFNSYCKNNGIIQQFTVPSTPQQNGVAERKNMTLMECARSMLKGKNISNGFCIQFSSLIFGNMSKCLGNQISLNDQLQVYSHKEIQKAFLNLKS